MQGSRVKVEKRKETESTVVPHPPRGGMNGKRSTLIRGTTRNGRIGEAVERFGCPTNRL